MCNFCSRDILRRCFNKPPGFQAQINDRLYTERALKELTNDSAGTVSYTDTICDSAIFLHFWD